MRRYNSEGVDRRELAYILTDGLEVRRALARNQCLVCRMTPVNEAALCTGCLANLTDIEQIAAEPWMEGRRT